MSEQVEDSYEDRSPNFDGDLLAVFSLMPVHLSQQILFGLRQNLERNGASIEFSGKDILDDLARIIEVFKKREHLDRLVFKEKIARDIAQYWTEDSFLSVVMEPNKEGILHQIPLKPTIGTRVYSVRRNGHFGTVVEVNKGTGDFGCDVVKTAWEFPGWTKTTAKNLNAWGWRATMLDEFPVKTPLTDDLAELAGLQVLTGEGVRAIFDRVQELDPNATITGPERMSYVSPALTGSLTDLRGRVQSLNHAGQWTPLMRSSS